MNKQGKLFTYRLTLPAGNLYAQQLHKHPGFKGGISYCRLRRTTISGEGTTNKHSVHGQATGGIS